MRHIRFLLLGSLMAATACWAAPQSATFNGANYLRFTPTGSPWSSLTSWRVEFRLHGFGTSTQTQGVYGNNDGDGQCQIPPNSTLLRCRTYRGTDQSVDISLNGRTDIRVRFQRDNTAGKLYLEVWNADGSGYVSAQMPYTPGAYDGRQANYIGSLWGAGSQLTGSVAFLRWYSTLAPLQNPAPPDSVTVPADLFDAELDGVTTDASPAHRSVSLTGTPPVFSNTQLFPPATSLPVQIVRAGQTLVLDASGSSNLTDDQPLQYFWTCVSAPVLPCDFELRNGPSARLRTLLGGTYKVRLRVTDSQGQFQTVDVEMGAVPADTSDRVILPSPALEKVLGPMLRSGTSPWPWFDTTEQRIADALSVAIPPGAGAPAAAGTVSVTPGSAIVTGVGTSFLSVFACNGTSEMIVLYYPLQGGGTGRKPYFLTSCQSNTQLTMNQPYDAGSVPASGVSFGRMTLNESAQWVNGSNNWNYYDAVVAFYRLYYRTGITKYRDMAQSLADKWWLFPIDGGRGSVSGPRSFALFGLMLRAVDGKPEYWPGILAIAELNYSVWLNGYYPYQPNSDIGEIREQGYVSLWTILIAILHPDATERSKWLARSQLAFNYWKNNQKAHGGWAFTLDPQQNYAGSGSFPWQGAFLANYLMIMHRHTGDPLVLATLKKYADYMIAEGIDVSNDGGFYEDSTFVYCPDYGAERTGTANVTNGSTTITGNGTQFQSQYACNGTDTIAIQDGSGVRRGYTVNSCSSQTSMTIASAYGGSTESGRRILKYAGAGVTPPSACHNTYGLSADSKQASRTLLNATHGYFGYLYSTGQGDTYKTVGDRIFAQNLGLGGPGNDGVAGHYNDVISGGTAPLYLAMTYLSKEFAFAGGAAGAQPYLALRLGAVPGVQAMTFKVSIALGSVPNAAKARVTLTQPSGASTQSICTSSPCDVTGDRRQGDHQVLIEYLATDNKVLATGDRGRIRVP